MFSRTIMQALLDKKGELFLNVLNKRRKMDEDRLLIITRIKKTYEYILKSLLNYPHKYLFSIAFRIHTVLVM